MDYYDSIAKGYEELHGDEQRKKIALILPFLHEKIKNKRDLKILDVGCGTGILFDFFPELKKEFKIGIDPSKELIGIAKKKKNGTYRVGKAENLPFKNDEFDIVVSLTAIQNFTDIGKGLQEIKRVGKSIFALTFLKKSQKKELIEKSIEKIFTIIERIEEEKDVIYLCI